jgi:hypothetical protein
VADNALYTNSVWTYPDAAYDVEVTAQIPASLILDNGTASGSLVDQQIQYYQVTIPATVNGYPLAGWKIGTRTTTGSAKLFISKNGVPNATNQPTLAVTSPFAVLTAPYLEPGTWYIAVQGVGITDYTITSEIISADPTRNRRSWNMPAKNGSFTQAGLTAPMFGDSGIDNLGNPIINPSTGDQGTDLGRDDWHFYRISIPDANGAILKTMLEALSGKPELYIRKSGVPSTYHKNNVTDPNDYYSSLAYDRSQTLTGTMYGNWVPLDRRTETQLAQGDWWIGIKAVNSNIRYRLKLSAGNVRDINGPVDSSGYFQDLNLAAGSKTGQTLAAGDFRYYRVTVPQSSTTLASSTPLTWNLNLTQQVGDVGIMIRDTIPPGMGTNGDINYLSGFMDWSKDNSYLSSTPYVTIDNPGTTVIATPPLRPGATYYLGVYAKTDSTFDLSSSVGTEQLKLDGIIPFVNGSLSTTLAAGEQRLYRVDVPADGAYWRSSSQHTGGVRLYLAQGTPPPKDYYAHWYSNGSANTTINQMLTVYPWQGGYSYYLVVENTTGGVLPFTFTMDGRTSVPRLTTAVAGTGTGYITSSPSVVACPAGPCAANLTPDAPVTLYAYANTGSTFAGWSGGACTGTNYSCSLTMDAAKDVTATFNLTPGTCGTDNNKTLSVSVPTNLCSNSTASIVTGSGHPWEWSCQGAVGTLPVSCSATIQTYSLTVTVPVGSGSGDVQADVISNDASPISIFCPKSFCSAQFDYGTTVRLTATPDSISLFSSWAGNCVTDPCDIQMSGIRAVTANFVRDYSFNNVTKGLRSDSLDTLITSADPGDEIRMLATEITINTLILNKALKLTGGWKALHQSQDVEPTILNGLLTINNPNTVISNTTMKGKINVQSGKLHTDGVKIKP